MNDNVAFFARQKPKSRAASENGQNSFAGSEGVAIVTATIRPLQPGRVKFQGSWWFARCEQNIIILPKTLVYVVGIDNITLIVEPIAA